MFKVETLEGQYVVTCPQGTVSVVDLTDGTLHTIRSGDRAFADALCELMNAATVTVSDCADDDAPEGLPN